MGVAAYPKKVQVSANDSTYYDVPANSVSLNLGAAVLDDTEFKNNAGYRTRALGLLDWSVSIEALYIASDSALGAIRTALTGRSALYVKYLVDGTNGYKGPVVVENYNMSGEVGDLEKISISLQADGALSATP